MLGKEGEAGEGMLPPFRVQEWKSHYNPESQQGKGFQARTPISDSKSQDEKKNKESGRKKEKKKNY